MKRKKDILELIIITSIIILIILLYRSGIKPFPFKVDLARLKEII